MAVKPRFDGEPQPLTERVEYVRGVTYKAATDLHVELNDDSYILLRANNIQDGSLSFDEVQYVDRSKVKSTQLLRKGDILVCASSGSKNLVGKAALVQENMPATFGAFCCVLRPKKGESEYLGHYFQSLQYRNAIEEVCSGSNINNLKASSFKSLVVPHYSYDGMRSIVEKMAALDSQKRKARAQLVKLDALVKSRFVEMFESSNEHDTSIGDLVTSMHIGPFGSAMKNDAFVSIEEASCVVYEQKHAIKKSINLDWRYVDEAKHRELARFEAGPGTILVSCRGTLGKVYRLPDDAPVGVIHPSLMKIEIDESKLETCFFTHLLEKIFADEEKRSEGSGVKMAIKAKDLAKMRIALPPLTLQREFAAFVAEVDKSRFIAQQQIKKLQMLYDSLAQEYFS